MKNSKILHCLPALDDGLSSHLCERLVTQLSPRLDHSIVTISGVPDVAHRRVRAHFPADLPQFDGMPTPGRLTKIAQSMAAYDLVLTYDYGALNVAMAHTAFSQAFGLPPLIHHEFGYGESDSRELTGRRNWYRRIALGRAYGIVVPSERLEGLALTTWQQPIGRVKHIFLGVKVDRKPRKVAADSLRGLIKRDGEQWIGTLGNSAERADWLQVLGALERLPENWQLIVAGEDAHLAALREHAEKSELSHRVHFPGVIEDPSVLLGLLDIYIELESSDVFPFNPLQAMAVALPIAGISTADLRQLTSEANIDYIVERNRKQGLREALVALAQHALARVRAGEQNHKRADDEFSEDIMIDKFRRLYASALGREL
ncbi:MAG TPA: glycosyl transferase family 1 [Erythrobacter sp.]|nr:glycosyl transferase family 1 [Erythrobacter sp.]